MFTDEDVKFIKEVDRIAAKLYLRGLKLLFCDKPNTIFYENEVHIKVGPEATVVFDINFGGLNISLDYDSKHYGLYPYIEEYGVSCQNLDDALRHFTTIEEYLADDK